MKPLPVLLRLLVVAGLLAGALPAGANVLLIIADDLGVDSFPLTAKAGASVPPMPNLSALKSSGVLFANAYAHPVCSPSRAAMLTGRHPFRTGIGIQLESAASPQLQAGEFTLPEAFAANAGLGYSLAMFGKWHLNAGSGTNDTPRTVGAWPHFAGTIAGALPDYYAWTKVVDGVASAATTYATTDTINDTIAWIATQGSTPWFAWVAVNAPHTPFHLPPLDLHSYDSAAATDRNYYEAACEALDTEVGRLLAAVDLTTTTVIFIGDNGTPPSVIQAPYTSAHGKGSLYDGGTRVPLIIAGKGVVSPNRTSSAPVHCVDLYSTILEAAGIDVAATQPSSQTLDSRSLMPIVKNLTETQPRYAFVEQFGTGLTTAQSGQALVDASGYKLIQFDDGHEEFYNTTSDPNEATTLLGNANLTTTDQAAYARLKLQMATASGTEVPNIPLLTSWFTRNSGEYARLYESAAAMALGQSVTTWSRGSGVQSLPTYAGVHQVEFSADWVYIQSTGLPSHTMGPWYLNAAKDPFPNFPSNTATIFRFPRTPVIPTTKTLFGGGPVGCFVDGVSVFDIRDAFYWNGSSDVSGSGTWNRDAYVNEKVTFDNAGAHQAGNTHHYHANPIALRYLLGDHVDYDAATNTYSESTGPVTRHSPIIGWVKDGIPIYGPYGYNIAMDATSGVRRMISGFTLRNGTNGADNLTTTRTTIPQWAVRAYGISATQSGPPVSSTYPLGRYLEDNAYKGDLINPATGQAYKQGTDTQPNDFDLDERNVRYCVTPEFPNGTWAYFLCIDAAGNPVFPYQVARSYQGDPKGGSVTGISETVTTTFVGGQMMADSPGSATRKNNDVTVSWNGVEGGIYSVDVSADLGTWTPLASNVVASGDDLGTLVDSGGGTQAKRFYRTTRTGLSNYDKTGFAGTRTSTAAVVGGGPNTVVPASGSKGTVVNVVIELDASLSPPLPPASFGVSTLTVSGTGVTVSNIARPSQTLVTATFTIAAGAASGARDVTVRFNNTQATTRTLTGGFTVN